MSASYCLRILPGVAALGATLVASTPALAHFVLSEPAASTEQDNLGNPQKAPPCGDNGNAVPTGTVTAFSAGDTVTITIDETIYHPGHYRVALAVNDPSELPEPPPVTPGNTPCGSAPIDQNPAFPVLADGLWVHDQPLDGPQSIDITLPDDVSCDGCTLQVIQFMSDHALNDPGGCYYHHCATISIAEGPVGGSTSGSGTTSSADGTSGGPSGDGSSSNGDGNGSSGGGPGDDSDTANPTATATDAGTDTGQDSEDSDGGCGCSTSGPSDHLGGLLGLLGLLGLRRRRQS